MQDVPIRSPLDRPPARRPRGRRDRPRLGRAPWPPTPSPAAWPPPTPIRPGVAVGSALGPRRAGGGRATPGWPPGATAASGRRPPARSPRPPIRRRTCFERDRDRILHATAFRRLAGKTQVFVFPADHQRTRLTHALEVAQVAGALARALRLNVALTEAIALGHDCGHGPGGHASEEALAPYLPGGFDHAEWGADVALAPLNLCAETLDGVRNHSWSRPSPATPEGEVVAWADRIAYVCHDFEDAVSAGVVAADDLPDTVADALRSAAAASRSPPSSTPWSRARPGRAGWP